MTMITAPESEVFAASSPFEVDEGTGTDFSKRNDQWAGHSRSLLEDSDRLRQENLALKAAQDKLLSEFLRLKEENSKLKQGQPPLKASDEVEISRTDIIGRSTALQAVLKSVSIVAPTGATVLIHGETGTGKELIARAIHATSLRRDRTLANINCAAIPTGLLESELFGYERGAFTGAFARKAGRFEAAHEGTLFLDEVGDIPSEIQPKLLRVLQEKELERLGGTQTQRVNVRLVAATSRDLSKMVADRQFRSDLYYRLNVFPIFLPPLRERSQDIPLLVEHFVKQYTRQMKKPVESVDPQDMEAMKQYSWPGNIRELQNFVERAVIMSTGKVLEPPLSELHQASLNGAGSANVSLEAGTLEECERAHILRTLERTRWLVGGCRGAATILGLKRTTLIGKMKKLGIARDQP
jgi:formate hydrogenlyase transcriptional activator